MKLSVSLPEDDVTFLDLMVKSDEMGSRSAALHRAVQALRMEVLGDMYEAAWDEGMDPAWDVTLKDGLADETW